MGTPPGIDPPEQPEANKPAKRPRKIPVKIPPRDYVTDAWDEHERGLQNRTNDFLLKAYGSLLAVTMLIYLLQGFHLWGFHLEETTLHWLGAATIGQIAGLLAITIKSVFGKKNR